MKILSKHSKKEKAALFPFNINLDHEARESLRDLVQYLAQISAEEDYNYFLLNGKIPYNDEDQEGISPS